MKNILKYLIFILLTSAFLFLGCNKFLEEDLRDAITPDNFFNNDKEAELAVNGIYKYLLNGNLYGLRGLDDYYTSGADIQGASRNVNREIHNYLIAEGVADGNGTWSQLYEIINGANEFLANIEGNEKLSQEARDLRVGELLFLRALAYYHLTNLWGDVPYLREPMDPIEAGELGRFDKVQIRTDMKADLERAISLLPADANGNPSRASKWAAAMLKAKFHLFDKEWAKCKEECDFIINSSPHKLLSNYTDIFNRTDPDNAYNDELIFVVDFKADSGGDLSTRRTDDYNPRIRDEPKNRNARPGGAGTPRNFELLQAAMADRNEDMTGYGWSIPLPDFAERENWEDGDLRYDATIVTEYLGFELQFPYFRKMWNLNQDISKRENHPENYIVFRLADTYLMAAEAENEMNGPADAYAYVNKVRERAFDPDKPWNGMTQTQFREAMYDERKFELSAEGHRRMDLIRWGILLEVVKNTTQRSWNNPADNIQPYHVLLPIPQQQIILNPHLLDSDPTNNGYR